MCDPNVCCVFIDFLAGLKTFESVGPIPSDVAQRLPVESGPEVSRGSSITQELLHNEENTV